MLNLFSPVVSPPRRRLFEDPTHGKGGGVVSPITDLLLVIGQSNAIAYGVSTPTDEVAAINPNRVRIYNGVSAFEGYVAGVNAQPSGQYPTKWGPEAAYAIKFLADHPGAGLGIVKRPIDGSGIASWQTGQSNFDTMTDLVDAAKALLPDGGASLNSINVLIVNGETDAIGDQALADAYSACLSSLISDARSAWGNAQTRFAMARVRNGLAFSATVRAAQNTVAMADPLVYLVDADDFTRIDAYHYNTASTILLGNRMYDAITTGQGLEYEASKSLANLTGASAPSGYAASASSSFNATFLPWKAFDGSLNESTGRWATTAPAPGNAATITLETPTAVKLGAFTYIASTGVNSASPTSITLEGSNDGVTWSPILALTGLSWGSNETKLFEIPPSQRGTYSRHRWSLGVSSSNSFSALEIVPLLAA